MSTIAWPKDFHLDITDGKISVNGKTIGTLLKISSENEIATDCGNSNENFERYRSTGRFWLTLTCQSNVESSCQE